MHALRFLFSPSGRLRPQPFVFAAAGVYAAGVASHGLTTADVIARVGLWAFVAVQVLIPALHDAGGDEETWVPALGLHFSVSVLSGRPLPAA